jgi:hypothetical protein
VVKATSANSSELFGVVSTSPGVLLSGISDSNGSTNLVNPKPIALTGRIPTNVSTENGPISVGDYLTISSTPGVAMKATAAGPVIGRALEDYSGSGVGSIEVFAQAGYYGGDDLSSMVQNGGDANLTNLSTSGNTTLANLSVTGPTELNNLNVSGSTTLASLTVTETTTTQDLSVTNMLTTQNLAVNGTAEVATLEVDGGINLGSSNEDPTQASPHPVTVRFKASKAIPAGSVVIADTRTGYVTTTTTTGDTRVIGVAVTSAASAGDVIEIAIGGTAKVLVSGTPAIGQLLEAGSTEGEASVASSPKPGEVIGKVLSSVDQNSETMVLVTLE